MNGEFKKSEFKGYEYKDVTVKKTMQSLYADSLSNFGWSEEGTSEAPAKIDSIIMKFKRNRKIRNKAELTRLERHFESCISEIESLEQSKKTMAVIVAGIVGVIGTAFMAGSVFAVTGGNIPLCIILAIPGFIGWIIPYFIFQKISSRKTKEVNPLIDQKYDELYDVCEKANSLLD